MSGGSGSKQVRRQWRWFRSPSTGNELAKAEFHKLPVHGQAALADAIKRWCRGEALSGEVRPLADAGGLFEIRVQVGRDPFRAIFFKDSPVHDVCVLAVYKNQRKLPQADKQLALKRMQEWKAARATGAS